MLQVNTTSPANASVVPDSWQIIAVVASIATIISVAFNFIQYKNSQKRNLSKEVYEPLLNELDAIIDITSWAQLGSKMWKQFTVNVWKENAVIGTLLKKDDKRLFEKARAFYVDVQGFNSMLEVYDMNKTVVNPDIKRLVNEMGELLISIRNSGDELFGLLQNKVEN